VEPLRPRADCGCDGIETRLLDGDLVNFHESGERDCGAAMDYAEKVTQYALISCWLRAECAQILVDEEGGIWAGDAV
jgi:hypothetical protein